MGADQMGHASSLAITGLGSDTHALVAVVQRSTHSAISVEGFGRRKETWMLGIGNKNNQETVTSHCKRKILQDETGFFFLFLIFSCRVLAKQG